MWVSHGKPSKRTATDLWMTPGHSLINTSSVQAPQTWRATSARQVKVKVLYHAQSTSFSLSRSTTLWENQRSDFKGRNRRTSAPRAASFQNLPPNDLLTPWLESTLILPVPQNRLREGKRWLHSHEGGTKTHFRPDKWACGAGARLESARRRQHKGCSFTILAQTHRLTLTQSSLLETGHLQVWKASEAQTDSVFQTQETSLLAWPGHYCGTPKGPWVHL